jgi:hypothetical protein
MNRRVDFDRDNDEVFDVGPILDSQVGGFFDPTGSSMYLIIKKYAEDEDTPAISGDVIGNPSTGFYARFQVPRIKLPTPGPFHWHAYIIHPEAGKMTIGSGPLVIRAV